MAARASIYKSQSQIYAWRSWHEVTYAGDEFVVLLLEELPWHESDSDSDEGEDEEHDDGRSDSRQRC